MAKARTPDATFVVGDMFELPFPDASFDVVTSFNGIWAGCEAALVEVCRVLRPGGRFGMTFWGSPTVWAEWPDLDIAVRALAASGPSQPAIAHSGRDQLAAELRKALAPLEDEDLGLRLSNESGYVTSTRP